MTTNGNEAGKKQRREQARETARQMREVEQKRKRRNRFLVQGGVVLGSLAIIAVIALVIVNSARPAGANPLNMLSDGILLTGDGTTVSAVTTAAIAADAEPVASDPTKFPDAVSIVTYVDYMCPYCGQFELTNTPQITTWVAQGAATIEVHPISILDSQSQGGRYSTRAANAVACVANFDPDKFLDASTALFDNQPAEGTSGLTNAELASTVAKAGVTNVDVAKCISDETFTAWVKAATERTNPGPIPNSSLDAIASTPTVLVNGIQYTGGLTDPVEFSDFVASVASGTYSG